MNDLTPEEIERMETQMTRLFAGVQPGPLLEDRTIEALRAAHLRRRVLAGWKGRLAVGVAASVGLGILGAGTSSLAASGDLPLPGGPGFAAQAANSPIYRESLAEGRDVDGMALSLAKRHTSALGSASDVQLSVVEGGFDNFNTDKVVDLTNPDRGLDPELMAKVDDTRWYEKDNSKQLPQIKESIGSGTTNLYAKWMDTSDGTVRVVPTNETNQQQRLHFNYYAAPNWKLGTELPKAEPKPAVVAFGIEAAKPDEKWGKEGHGEAGKTLLGRYVVPVNNPQAPPPPADPAVNRKIVIRTGEVEFEVDSFDTAVEAASALIGKIKDASVSTINSEKLPNGKVKGAIVVRVPPDQLDGFVLNLRKELGKIGELKGQKISSQEITKQYTDLESRLKAAKTMETRLLQIIKDGKGEIKQLLDAEKELGVWRIKIEETEGELRYYANQVALSTLTITLAEKEIRAATGITESERVQAGLEVEDVDKSLQQAVAAVTEAKGRMTKSELKQLAAGQFNATLHFTVAPDAAGPLRDRLRQIGRVARLEIDRVQQAEGGTPPKDAKVTRGDAQFQVSIYNLANIAPREVAVLQVAVPDVPTGFQALKEILAKANGRVLAAALNEQDRQNVTAQLDFEVRRPDEAALQSGLASLGDTIARNVTRAAETENATDAKVLFRTTLVSAARLKPRETATLAIEVQDVDATAAVFGAQVAEAKGRQVDAQVAHERGGRVTAKLVYDVPLAAAPGLVEKFKTAGQVRVQQSARDPHAPDGRYATARIDVTLANVDPLVANDDGFGQQVRRGLSFSANALLMSVSWVIFGLCVVVPWAVVGYGGYRLFRRLFRSR